MDKKVEELIENCIACQVSGQRNPVEPLKINPTIDIQWTELAIDWTVFTNRTILTRYG